MPGEQDEEAPLTAFAAETESAATPAEAAEIVRDIDARSENLSIGGPTDEELQEAVEEEIRTAEDLDRLTVKQVQKTRKHKGTKSSKHLSVLCFVWVKFGVNWQVSCYQRTFGR